MTLAVRYLGSFPDSSGYGSANRAFVTALYLAGVDVTTEIVAHTQAISNYGWSGELCRYLEGRTVDYKIKILHLTPDTYPRYIEKGKYNIGHLFWETDKLPKEWIVPCNQVNEIWTASESQAKMIKDSGVTVPIHWFPQPVDLVPGTKEDLEYIIPNFSGFIFYSIFQWIERKNPKGLLTAYWKAFQGVDDVCLVLKTYGYNYSDGEFARIKSDIERWKKELNLQSYPKVYLVKKLFNESEMFKLHKTGDCFVTASRGEGWQRPAVEAMTLGKPVIGIDKTGFADYLTEDLYYPCKTFESQVVQVSQIPWYTSDMKWLEVVEKDLIENMMTVYKDRKEAHEKGDKAKQYVTENFNYWTIGQKMKDRLEEILKFI